MRALIGALVVLGIAGSATAQDGKIDAKKLVGKWSPYDSEFRVTLEYTDKGELILSTELDGNPVKWEGTYKLEGVKLAIELSLGDREMKETSTISKLTDDELVVKDSKGNEVKFKKIKPK